MTWNTLRAVEILEANPFCTINDTLSVSKSYRYACQKEGHLKHIAIAAAERKEFVTVYINASSLFGAQFPNTIENISIVGTYGSASEDEKGNPGIAASVARVPTLNPKNNSVMRLNVFTEDAFVNLLNWYIGQTSTTAPASNITQEDLNKTDESILFMDDPLKRKAIEQAAVLHAIAHYKSQGYEVTEYGKPFDLLCKKDHEIIHVEVKGSTSKANKVILTRNEVIDCKNPEWRSDLYILENIILDNASGQWIGSGGNAIRFENWTIDETLLSPLQFEYTIK